MTTFQLLIVCWTVALLAALAAAAVVYRASLAGRVEAPLSPPPRVGHRVTVHTKQPDDQTFFGVLTGDYADRIVLEDAGYVGPHGETPLPGTQHVATRDIAWIDVHALVATPEGAIERRSVEVG